MSLSDQVEKERGYDMDETGVRIIGYIAGSEEKVGEYDGQRKVSYRYLLVSGMDSYVVTSDTDYRQFIVMNDLVTFIVKPRVYGGKIFYSAGRLIQ